MSPQFPSPWVSNRIEYIQSTFPLPNTSLRKLLLLLPGHILEHEYAGHFSISWDPQMLTSGGGPAQGTQVPHFAPHLWCSLPHTLASTSTQALDRLNSPRVSPLGVLVRVSGWHPVCDRLHFPPQPFSCGRATEKIQTPTSKYVTNLPGLTSACHQY